MRLRHRASTRHVESTVLDSIFYQWLVDVMLYPHLSDNQKHIAELLMRGMTQAEIVRNTGCTKQALSQCIQQIRHIGKARLSQYQHLM